MTLAKMSRAFEGELRFTAVPDVSSVVTHGLLITVVKGCIGQLTELARYLMGHLSNDKDVTETTEVTHTPAPRKVQLTCWSFE